MRLLPDERPAGPWRTLSTPAVVDAVLAVTGDAHPAVVAIDGRGASGKTTRTDALLADLAGRGTAAAAVHTDDLAWHEPFFGWGHLLRAGVLEPAKRREVVVFTPPAWEPRGRTGSVDVPAGTEVLVVEGTGAYQRDFDHLYDAVVWVQSDVDEAERRGIERDVASGVNGGRERATAFWHEWMAAEVPYLAEQRAWDRADLTVAGTHVVELADGEWAVADRTPGARRNA